MHSLFTFARFYPAFAISIAIAFIQAGMYFQRRRTKARFYLFGVAMFFIATAILWLVLRGDLYSDQWVRSLLQSTP